MTDILVDWSDGSVARSLRFKGKLREVGEDLTSRVILGAEHWLADKVDVARNITISHSNNIYKLITPTPGGGESDMCGETALRVFQENRANVRLALPPLHLC